MRLDNQDRKELRVLLVEDSEHDRFAFRRALKNGNMQSNITEYQNAEEAFERIQAERAAFDIAVIDHKLPGMHGIDFSMKLLELGVSFPIVIFTGHGSEELAVKALKAGVCEYLIKDSDSSYLKLLPHVIRDVVARHSERLEYEHAVEETKSSRRLLSQIIQGSPVPSFVIDTDHVLIEWNRACENITRFSATEMVGTRLQWQAFYEEERPVLADLIVDRVPEDEILRRYEGKCQKSKSLEGGYESGGFFPRCGDKGKWLFFTAAPLTDPEGRILGAIETLQDVTDQKQAEMALQENEERYKILSITDSMTGLYNSRHFFAEIYREIERSKRHGSALSLLLIDFDNFKSYNDTFGHLEGDKVLATLGAVLTKNLRSYDSAYRYGGDEFTILLPEANADRAIIFAERISKEFSEIVFSPIVGENIRKTLSIGVSQYKTGETAELFIKRADEGTYSAKKQGRNRIVFVE